MGMENNHWEIKDHNGHKDPITMLAVEIKGRSFVHMSAGQMEDAGQSILDHFDPAQSLEVVFPKVLAEVVLAFHPSAESPAILTVRIARIEIKFLIVAVKPCHKETKGCSFVSMSAGQMVVAVRSISDPLDPAQSLAAASPKVLAGGVQAFHLSVANPVILTVKMASQLQHQGLHLPTSR